MNSSDILVWAWLNGRELKEFNKFLCHPCLTFDCFSLDLCFKISHNKDFCDLLFTNGLNTVYQRLFETVIRCQHHFSQERDLPSLEVFHSPKTKIVERNCRASQISPSRTRLCGKLPIYFAAATLTPQNWCWQCQVQFHKQVTHWFPFHCWFQEEARRRRQWRWGRGSCRRPRPRTSRGTWGGQSRWTSLTSWEYQGLHMRMYRPGLLKDTGIFNENFALCTYSSHDHTIQWMPKQPDCLKKKSNWVNKFSVGKNTWAGTVEKWQKENP